MKRQSHFKITGRENFKQLWLLKLCQKQYNQELTLLKHSHGQGDRLQKIQQRKMEKMF